MAMFTMHHRHGQMTGLHSGAHVHREMKALVTEWERLDAYDEKRRYSDMAAHCTGFDGGA